MFWNTALNKIKKSNIKQYGISSATSHRHFLPQTVREVAKKQHPVAVDVDCIAGLTAFRCRNTAREQWHAYVQQENTVK